MKPVFMYKPCNKLLSCVKLKETYISYSISISCIEREDPILENLNTLKMATYKLKCLSL